MWKFAFIWKQFCVVVDILCRKCCFMFRYILFNSISRFNLFVQSLMNFVTSTFEFLCMRLLFFQIIYNFIQLTVLKNAAYGWEHRFSLFVQKSTEEKKHQFQLSLNRAKEQIFCTWDLTHKIIIIIQSCLTCRPTTVSTKYRPTILNK